VQTTFRVLFVFVVLSHERRRSLHLNVTAHPTTAWTRQQLREAFPWDRAPRFLLRDRNEIYGAEFTRTVQGDGPRGGPDGTAVAVAESVREAGDRLDSPRVPGPRDHLERAVIAAAASAVPGLLSSLVART
jgi:hypothetical protein